MQTITFGTDGIRGHADSYPFTSSALFTIGCALAQWAQGKYHIATPKILICGDTRVSLERIKHHLIQGLIKFPVTIIDAGILPTPALCQLMKQDQSFDFGIVISASHNPYHDNGIKIFGKKGLKISAPDETIVTNFFEQYALHPRYTHSKDYGQVFVWQTAASAYHDSITNYFATDFLKGLTVVLDCAHGATTQSAPAIFKSLGAKVIELAAQPNGFNINDQSGALHPSLLAQEVIRWNADLGFAFDGDGDRVIAVNRAGHIKDGDDILYQLLGLPEYSSENSVVGTVMTNQGFEYALHKLGKQLVRVPVGDKHITACMEQENLVLGGESSGHIILKNYLPTCDAIFTALMVIKSFAYTGNWHFETFEKFPQILINVPVSRKKNLDEYPYQTIIQEHELLLNQGRVLVRYSGTENLLRVMTEADTFDRAQSVAEMLAFRLQQALSFE